MKKFLVVVDTQYDFMMPDGALYVPGAEELIVPGNKFLANLDSDVYDAVLFTYDTHTPEVFNGSPESEQFPIHCVRGTPGYANVFNPGLIGGNIPTLSLVKGVFSMWEEEKVTIFNIGDPQLSVGSQTWDRDELFAGYDKKTTLIEVMGVASDYCVKQAVDGFVKLGFAVHVKDELCRGIQATAKETFDTAEYIGNVAVR